MHAVTEFQARVIIVAERDRLDGYRARARGKQRRGGEGKKIAPDERSTIVEQSDRKRRDNSRITRGITRLLEQTEEKKIRKRNRGPGRGVR